MMRKIMADRVMMDYGITTRPGEAQKTMRIPEPNSGNSEKSATGLIGVADYVRSYQRGSPVIQRAGDYIPYYEQYGGTFRYTPAILKDVDDADIYTALRRMGADEPHRPRFLQMASAYNQTNILSSPKMIELKKWGDAGSDYGYLGLMAWVARQGGVAHLPQIMRLTERQQTDTEEAYKWEVVVHDLPQLTSGSAIDGAIDMVELDDGSIFLVQGYVTATTFYLNFYRSYDGGTSWTATSTYTIAGMTANAMTIAIDRIGSRLVMVIGNSDGAGPATILDSRYSDDNGLSWSFPAVDIHGVATATTGKPTVDLVVGQDGLLYCSSTYDFIGTDTNYIASTSDGTSWTQIATTGSPRSSLLQTYFGRWISYSADPATTSLEMSYSDQDTPLIGGTVDVLTGGVDANVTIDEVCARTFNMNGFQDVMTLYQHSGGYYSIAVYRMSMWCGVQLSDATGTSRKFDICWSPNAYPSAADPAPDLAAYTQVLAAAGASILSVGEDGYLQIAVTAAGADILKYQDPGALPATSYTTGIAFSFTLKQVSGYSHIECRLDAAAAHVQWSIIFDQAANRIRIWDHILGGGTEIASINPDDWSVDEWNEYAVVAKGTTLQIYQRNRAWYDEIAHEDLILDVTLTAGGGIGSTWITWGADNTNGSGYSGVGVGYWKHFFLNYTGTDDEDWDYADDIIGRKCSSEPVGIMQGFGVKWEGPGASDEGNYWTLETGAQYAMDNITLDSPSMRWQEPSPATGESALTLMEWSRFDSAGNEIRHVFDSFALFGRNWEQFGLYGSNNGADYDLLTAGMNTYLRNHTVSAIDKNVLTLTMGSYDNMIPDEFASNEHQKFYVRFTSGLLEDYIFKIVGNTETDLIFDRSLEDLNADVADELRIFTDRLFHQFSAMKEYLYLRLVISGVFTEPAERQLRLGTMVVGRVYDLEDDVWETNLVTVPNVQLTSGRSDIRAAAELGGERRELTLKYTGHIDVGMGITAPSSLWRFIRQGLHPVVWIDDDSALEASSAMAHHAPILLRKTGDTSQDRLCYQQLGAEGFSGGSIAFNRGLWEEQIKLSEIL